MPLTPPGPTPARSAADLNEAIRDLWSGGVLTDEARYRQLLVEWAEACKAERAAQDGAELAA